MACSAKAPGVSTGEAAQAGAPQSKDWTRTYFLSAGGELDPSIKARESGQFQYFYDEADPDSLLAGMGRARSTLR